MLDSSGLLSLSGGIVIGSTISIVSAWRKYRRDVRKMHVRFVENCPSQVPNMPVGLALLGCGRDSYFFQLPDELDDNAVYNYVMAINYLIAQRGNYIDRQWRRFQNQLYTALTTGVLMLTFLPLTLLALSYF